MKQSPDHSAEAYSSSEPAPLLANKLNSLVGSENHAYWDEGTPSAKAVGENLAKESTVMEDLDPGAVELHAAVEEATEADQHAIARLEAARAASVTAIASVKAAEVESVAAVNARRLIEQQIPIAEHEAQKAAEEARLAKRAEKKSGITSGDLSLRESERAQEAADTVDNLLLELDGAIFRVTAAEAAVTQTKKTKAAAQTAATEAGVVARQASAVRSEAEAAVRAYTVKAEANARLAEKEEAAALAHATAEEAEAAKKAALVTMEAISAAVENAAKTETVAAQRASDKAYKTGEAAAWATAQTGGLAYEVEEAVAAAVAAAATAASAVDLDAQLESAKIEALEAMENAILAMEATPAAAAIAVDDAAAARGRYEEAQVTVAEAAAETAATAAALIAATARRVEIDEYMIAAGSSTAGQSKMAKVRKKALEIAKAAEVEAIAQHETSVSVEQAARLEAVVTEAQCHPFDERAAQAAQRVVTSNQEAARIREIVDECTCAAEHAPQKAKTMATEALRDAKAARIRAESAAAKAMASAATVHAALAFAEKETFLVEQAKSYALAQCALQIEAVYADQTSPRLAHSSQHRHRQQHRQRQQRQQHVRQGPPLALQREQPPQNQKVQHSYRGSAQQIHRSVQSSHRGEQQSHRGAQQSHRGAQQNYRGTQQGHREVQQQSQRGAQQSHRGVQQSHHRGAQQSHRGAQQSFRGSTGIKVSLRNRQGKASSSESAAASPVDASCLPGAAAPAAITAPVGNTTTNPAHAASLKPIESISGHYLTRNSSFRPSAALQGVPSPPALLKSANRSVEPAPSLTFSSLDAYPQVVAMKFAQTSAWQPKPELNAQETFVCGRVMLTTHVVRPPPLRSTSITRNVTLKERKLQETMHKEGRNRKALAVQNAVEARRCSQSSTNRAVDATLPLPASATARPSSTKPVTLNRVSSSAKVVDPSLPNAGSADRVASSSVPLLERPARNAEWSRPDLMLVRDPKAVRTINPALIEHEMRAAEMMERLRLVALDTSATDDNDDDDAWSDIETVRSRTQKTTTRMRLRSVFDMFDADRSGAISLTELDGVLKELRIEKTPEETAALLKDADLNGDGEVDFEEFCAMFSRPNHGLASVFFTGAWL